LLGQPLPPSRTLPFGSGSLSAVTVALSIQYLSYPGVSGRCERAHGSSHHVQGQRIACSTGSNRRARLNLSLACTIFAEEVVQEIGRCLAPGGTCIISFSNRMFPSKAIYGWRRRSPPALCTSKPTPRHACTRRTQDKQHTTHTRHTPTHTHAHYLIRVCRKRLHISPLRPDPSVKKKRMPAYCCRGEKQRLQLVADLFTNRYANRPIFSWLGV
jgi:hypothetical protein